MLSAGDRAKAGFWRWMLSFIVLCVGIVGITFAFIYACEWLFGVEAVEPIYWEGVRKNRDDALLTYIFLFVSIALLIPAISLGLRVVKLKASDVIAPLSKMSFRLIAVIAILTLALMTVAMLTGLSTLQDQDAVRFDPLPLSYLYYVPAFLVAIIFQASAEELLLRGYLLQLIGRWTRNGWIILIVISAIFTSLHFANPEIEAFGLFAYYHYAIAAVLFTSLALITGRLEYSIGTHIGWNWLTFVIDMDSPIAPDLYTGLGLFVMWGDMEIAFRDWIAAGLQHLVLFLICLVIHFEYVEPRQTRSLR